MNPNPRKIAVQILYDVLKSKANLSQSLALYRKESQLTNLDIRFVSELTGGTIRNLEYIDYAVSLASDIKISKISPYVMCVLRIGAYQILFLDKVPPSAAVNESVKIIKSSSNRRLSGFVNAVLRKIIQTGRDFELPEDKIKNLSVRYSCPEWIIKNWEKRLGDGAEELAKKMNSKPETVIRTNTLKTTSSELCKKLNDEGWICSEYVSPVFPSVDYLIKAEKIEDIVSSQSYKDGLFYIQDSAGSYVSEVLSPKPGSTVFDMCASPGGKTTHIAEKMQNKGKIFAFDVSENKVKIINENAERLGIDIIHAEISDSSKLNEKYIGKADYLLVDSPCSGLGIIRKKPDIKYTREEQDSRELAKISLAILNSSAPYLKSGGTMVFSTCTTVYEENEKVLFEFLKSNPDFELNKIPCNKENDGYVTLYPHLDDCDGFFISLLKRK